MASVYTDVEREMGHELRYREAQLRAIQEQHLEITAQRAAEMQYLSEMERQRTIAEAQLDRPRRDMADQWGNLINSMGRTALNEPYYRQQENEMTTAFKLDLDSNRLSFGTVADGQMVDLDAEIKLKSERGASPIGGVIQGNFIGEVKGVKTIPITIPHKLENAGGFNIIVIGAGGTGGYVIRDLAKFVYALREKGDTRSFQIKLVDADIVESKNILRQNFTPRDLGKPKADVMARRYSNAFGLEIQAINKMIENTADLTDLFEHGNTGGRAKANIVIGCVDNNKARRVVKDCLRNNPRLYWIDSGNETRSGQVVCGFGRSNGTHRTPSSNTQFWLPNVTELYPEILDESQDEKEDTSVSCAERSLVDTQNIFVNSTAAGHVLNFIRQLIMEEPITINKVEFNIKGLSEVQHITEAYLTEVNDKVRRL